MSIPRPILSRRRRWAAQQSPPPSALRYAYPLRDNVLALAGPAAAGALLEADESRMYVRRVISTGDRDRVGDELPPEGCYLENYRLSPVVFFGHQEVEGFSLPVGLSETPDGRLDVKVVPGVRVEAGCYFHQHTREAVQVFVLAKDRVLRMTSVGFNPLAEPVPLRAKAGNVAAGYRYPEWDLVEWSFVGTPCNPFAGEVRRYLDLGRLAGEPIGPAMRKALLPLAAPRKAWLAWDGRAATSVPGNRSSGKARPGTLSGLRAALATLKKHLTMGP